MSHGKRTFYGRVLKSVSCVTVVCKAAAVEASLTIFANTLAQGNTLTFSNCNILTSNFASLITNGLGPYVARGL
jgi:hypothetical protein